MEIFTARMDSKGRIFIPENIRTLLNWYKGVELRIEAFEDRLMIIKARDHSDKVKIDEAMSDMGEEITTLIKKHEKK